MPSVPEAALSDTPHCMQLATLLLSVGSWKLKLRFLAISPGWVCLAEKLVRPSGPKLKRPHVQSRHPLSGSQLPGHSKLLRKLLTLSILCTQEDLASPHY